MPICISGRQECSHKIKLEVRRIESKTSQDLNGFIVVSLKMIVQGISEPVAGVSNKRVAFPNELEVVKLYQSTKSKI